MKKEAIKELIGQLISTIFLIFIITVILPVAIIVIENFFKLVVFGNRTMSEFSKEVMTVIGNFYTGIFAWLRRFYFKLSL